MRLRPLFDEKVEHAIDLLRYLERDRASVYWKNEYGQTSSRTIRAGEAFESCKARVDVPEVTLALKYYVHYANRPGGIFEYRLLRLADGNWYFYDLLSPSSAGCGGG